MDSRFISRTVVKTTEIRGCHQCPHVRTRSKWICDVTALVTLTCSASNGKKIVHGPHWKLDDSLPDWCPLPTTKEESLLASPWHAENGT
jgi:hypothetical protein